MTDVTEPQIVAVLGLGNMGSALAEALITGGHKVTVWNRTRTKCAPLSALGARVAATATDAAHTADIVVICVLDNNANQAVLLLDRMDAALDGKTLLQFTVLDPNQARTEAEWMQERNVRYLEGAILGFPADIRNGSAQIALSGDQDVFHETRDVVNCLAETAVHVGEEPGKASQAALVIYSRYYGIAFACLHTASLANAAGIPIQRLLHLTGGKDQWHRMGGIMDGYLEMVDKLDYSTSEATLNVDAADYDMFLRFCDDLGVDRAHHTVINGMLSRALAEGWGEHAIPAICEVMSSSPNVKKPEVIS